MIRSFKNRQLELLWLGEHTKIDRRLHKRILWRLDRLNNARAPEDMDIPGFNFHALRGFEPKRYTVHVNGPWCVTFAFEDRDAVQIDFEQYH